MSWCYDEFYGHAIYDSNATRGSNPPEYTPQISSEQITYQLDPILVMIREGCIYDSMANELPPGEHSETSDLTTLHPPVISILYDI